MKTLVKSVYIITSIIYIIYLLLPNYPFPTPTNDFLQSNEPADTETPLRRAYFTNYNRWQTVEHYRSQLERSTFLSLPLPTLRLNYPPEEAQTIIRDQTRSTYLEEIVHPFRESVFVNGFEPKSEKDTIFIEGRVWLQKITVRYVPSNTIYRLLIGIITVILIALVYSNSSRALSDLKNEVLKRWY